MGARVPARAIALAVILAGAGPGQARPVVPAVSAEQEPLRKALHAIRTLLDAGNTAGALAAIEAAIPSARDGSELRAFLHLTRIELLIASRRDSDVVVATELALAEGVEVDRSFLTAAADAAARTAQPVKTAAMLSAYAGIYPGSVNSLRWEFIAAVFNELRTTDGKAAGEAFALALFDAGYRCDNDLGGVRFVEMAAIDALVGEHRIAEARSRLPKLTSVRNLAGMAIDRRYEPLWPTLETLLGPQLRPAIGRDLDHIEQAFAADPDNLLIRQSYVRELTWLGAPVRAMALAEHLLTTPEAIAASGQYGWWLVAGHGDAMGAAGDPKAGLRRYQQLNLAIPRGNTGRIDTLIDEATFASRNGLSQEALSAAETVLKVEGISGFGKSYLWQVQACSLHRLGRDGENATNIARLEADPEQNRRAYLDAMLCLGRLGSAEALVLKVLPDPLRRMDMLLTLQRLAFDKHDAALGPAVARLAARPEVARAIQVYGRPLPAVLRPPD